MPSTYSLAQVARQFMDFEELLFHRITKAALTHGLVETV
jgi:hypothetical protein